ncbi:TetR/AcrR family transcriptional regulator [Pseudonocardia hispaniensis]|uniref:TetR/AcrR family transcriptional regulator n=1 Tax=Pseudonocardia hispaniensis TaxID=904933 RepID=A0ABW1J812_9PSEU
MTATGVRARVRAELTREIAEAARRQLATEGSAALSLRAVARELGMASSAVYRYFPSRDELLTRLVLDAYDALGTAVEQAEAAVPRADLRARFRAACRAVRTWALAHPHEYALVYGSPVPGYTAPQTTIGPASRVGEVLCRILADGLAGDVLEPGGPQRTLEPGIAERMGLPEGATLNTHAIMVWTSLFGLVSFELFGHTRGVVARHEAFFDSAVEQWADLVGVP